MRTAIATSRAAAPCPYEVLLEGKRFVCTECGKCCQGSGEVWANDKECAAMARHLGLQQSDFLARYTKAYSKRPGWRMLKLQPATGDCVFLAGGTKCSIYPHIPLVARADGPRQAGMLLVAGRRSASASLTAGSGAAAWVGEGRAVCEGIEHEEAPLVDAQDKAGVLRAATDYFADQQAAAEAGRRGRRRQP
ncbi:hypothetical protein CHLNCDRAFT_141281 [Chlorella variabilis]|uniref:Uncharacterized protein n=1 Tax=Chlorella variabilis TaxID=554065 RepID=E1ZSI6_CHLVA|nr:hypothetical protein CHLNCDRAFT_141281 [Chlorella variabilis]EFN51314.1 hypothetical protein CHLNCDRAFT_141281 [Chlorella variabilis]|eukprot:XP_005843416.1 hypothetical protein CHLNCDRAFT_141281 [Chlorella variabilis]